MTEAEGVHSVTDITGFGLIGHSKEMAEASGVAISLFSGKISFFPHSRELVLKKKNRPRNIIPAIEASVGKVFRGENVGEADWMLCFDPQTSGGLLISVATGNAEVLLSALEAGGVNASVVGEVVESRGDWTIKVE
jgi:selenide,water dikinase